MFINAFVIKLHGNGGAVFQQKDEVEPREQENGGHGRVRGPQKVGDL